MDHLDPGLAHVGLRRVMLRRSRRRDMTETSRPVRTAESRIRQARIAAKDHDDEAQHRAEQGEAPDPRDFAHRDHQPMCESLSSFLRSLSNPLVVWLESCRIMRLPRGSTMNSELARS